MESSSVDSPSQLEIKLGVLIEELRNSNGDTNDVQSLNKQIRALMNQLKTKIKNIETQLRVAKSNDEKDELKGLIDWHNSQLQDLQRNLQRANLCNKSQQDERNRQQLLGSVRNEETTVAQRKKGEGTVQASSNVTNSLRELRQKLASSLQGSEDTMRTLVDSSSLLKESGTEMKTMSSNIDISTHLITKFGRREVVDKLLIFFGLVLFFSVVLYILKKRILG